MTNAIAAAEKVAVEKVKAEDEAAGDDPDKIEALKKKRETAAEAIEVNE